MSLGTASGILVLGAGGHGKSVVSVLLASGSPVAGVFDDDPGNRGGIVLGVPIIGSISDFGRYADALAVIGIGDNAARRRVAGQFPNARWARVLYPQAYISPTARTGVGTVVFPGAVVGADVLAGKHVIVSANTTLGHDTVVGDYAHIAPGVQIGGGARIGSGAMLCLGSIVCPQVEVGEGAILAAGAVAVDNIPAGATAFGTPARVAGHRRSVR